MEKSKKNSSFWDRVFDRISPLRCLQFSMIAVLILTLIGAGSAAMWGLNHSSSTTVVYDYKTVDPHEYVEKNGVSVLSYNQETNIATVMMSEDVVNTVLHAYLKDQGYELSGVTIYEMVWRQKENQFFLQIQSGLFRVAVKASASVTYNSEKDAIEIQVGKFSSSEQGKVLFDIVPIPKLSLISIPVSFLNLESWKQTVNVAINSNEMLFEYSPDLKTVGAMIKDSLQAEEVYLAWSYSLKNATERSRTLKRVLEGDDFTEAEVKDLLHLLIDDQASLSSWMAMLTEESREKILKQWGIDANLINQTVIQKTQDDIKEKACTVYAAELLQSYKEYLNSGVDCTPDAIETRVPGLDNSVITFEEKDHLYNTAIISSNSADAKTEDEEMGTSEGEKIYYVMDRGAIFDYHLDDFITTELIQTRYPSDFPFVSELGQIRLYYSWEYQKPVVLVLENDGTMIEVSDSGTRQMMIEGAERFVPGFTETPCKAEERMGDNEELHAILSTLSRFFDQGMVFCRYCNAADNFAFVVFSTEQQAEKLRSAVLMKYDEEWSVRSLDVSDYESYQDMIPTVNSTIFPLEKITDYTIRTIPQEGLNLLLDKARQINLAGENDVLQFYYYMDNYVYTRFSNGKDCVFETDENQTILSCRSLESARANWDLPAFFVIQAQQNEGKGLLDIDENRSDRH